MASVFDDQTRDRGKALASRIGARLAGSRNLLAGLSALFFVLFLAGQLPGPLALAAVAVCFFLVMVFPRQTVSEKPVVLAAPRAGLAADAFPAGRTLLDTLPDPVLVLGPDGTIIHSNSASRASLSRVDAGASALIRFRNPELQERLRDTLASRKPASVEYVERGPMDRWFKVSLVPLLPDQAGVGTICVMHFRDLTESHRLDRMRRDFIGNASHELRTPLASLKGFLETLSGHAREDRAARERFLAIMKDQAERMERLIDDLLSLSRYETAMGRSNYQATDLAGVLFHVRSALAPTAQNADVTLDLDDESVLDLQGQVNGSRDELIQLFENLVENAIKYGGEGGHVRVSVRPAPVGNAVQVQVADNGPGIAQEHIPRLTERFYRVDVASSRAKQGTGLGLAIVKHIVTRHDGTLSIQSELGRGACFTVTLPLLPKSLAPVRNIDEKQMDKVS